MLVYNKPSVSILYFRFSRLAFNVRLRRSGISRVEYLELSVSANIAVAILRESWSVLVVLCTVPALPLHQSAPSQPILRKTTKLDQPIHKHPEDGNCNVCWNVGYLQIFDAVRGRTPKFYTLLICFHVNVQFLSDITRVQHEKGWSWYSLLLDMSRQTPDAVRTNSSLTVFHCVARSGNRGVQTRQPVSKYCHLQSVNSSRLVNQSLSQSVGQSFTQSVNRAESVGHSASGSVSQTFDRSATQPDCRGQSTSISRSVNQPASQLVIQSFTQSVNRAESVGHSISGSVSQPFGRSASQPDIVICSESAIRSVIQSTRHCRSQLTSVSRSVNQAASQ
jgi:hypothetical protein